ARDHVGGPVLAAPLPPDAVGPGDVEVAAVVLVQRLLHDVVDAERGLEAAQAQAPGRFIRTVLQVGLVDGGLAVLEPPGSGRVGPHPEFVVALFRVQTRGHAAAGVPTTAEVAAHAEARAGAEAVGIGRGAAAGAGFGADVAETDVAAGQPGIVGLRAGGGEDQRAGQRDACDRRWRWAPGGPALNCGHVDDLLKDGRRGRAGPGCAGSRQEYGRSPVVAP